MSEVVISAEYVSKKYNLGTISSGTLFRDLNMYWAKIRGKSNPYAKMNESGTFTEGEHWALNDVSFDIKQGDAVGIIGRNGAGKSTLLKILSRVTTPSSGQIKIKGRIASLLEVGTGFHPEMTGRENIFLNGAILGMNKFEIKKKFDEIVDFAGIEKYIDTPVKRYSSGMYVRLAFGVAAHLEPEILIVDEVLAVGDVEFQKKCLGKMNDVSKNEGRTVLFVSHNMGAVRQLCKKGLLLKNGSLFYSGDINDTIKNYLFQPQNDYTKKSLNGTLVDKISIQKIKINNSEELQILNPKHSITISVEYTIKNYENNLRISFILFKDGVRLITTHDLAESIKIKDGEYRSEIYFPGFFLRPGEYTVSIGGHNTNHSSYTLGNVEWFIFQDAFSFEILEEWSLEYDFNNLGLLNYVNNGKRITL